MLKRPGGALAQAAEPTRSQLIPILTKWQDVRARGQMIPIAACVVVFLLMGFRYSDDLITWPVDGVSPTDWVYTSVSILALATFLTLATLFFIYRLAGKDKNWWVLLGALAFTASYLWLFKFDHMFVGLYTFFHIDLAGGEPNRNMPFPELFWRHFLGTGPFEELVKAVPVLLLAIYTPRLAPHLRSTVGVQEPLDGIVVGAASGGGFALMETVLQFVPHQLVSYWTDILQAVSDRVNFQIPRPPVALPADQLHVYNLLQIGNIVGGTTQGIELTIYRSIDLAFGHMAYSGYFGYFIGLAVLKPEYRVRILLIGWLSAIFPHALWDSMPDNLLLTGASALFFYAVLAAAIIKARELSPNRALLQPSVVIGAGIPILRVSAQPPHAAAVVAERAYGPAQTRRAPEAYTPATRYETALAVDAGAATPARASVQRLRIGTKTMSVVAGLRLMEYQIPGLRAQSGGGLVAEMTRNPEDPAILGLTNRSTSAWEMLSPNGQLRTIEPGQTARLSRGTRIDFGSVEAEVE